MFKDHYRRVEELGCGAFGAAFKVQRRDDSHVVHVSKEIKLAHLSDKEREMARAEADLLRQVSHPNIIAYIGSYLEEKKLYIVMEYADGGDLARKINERKESAKFLCERRVVPILVQLAEALGHIHRRNILHRDVKPMNVFLTSQNQVKLGDFGVARIVDSVTVGAHTQVGTPYYLSPEVLNGESYGAKSDLWSLGVVIYELSALRLPFYGGTLPAVALAICGSQPEHLPERFNADLNDTVLSLLEKNPAHRLGLQVLMRTPLIRKYLSDSSSMEAGGAGGRQNHLQHELRSRNKDNHSRRKPSRRTGFVRPTSEELEQKKLKELEEARLAAFEDRKLARERAIAFKRQETTPEWSDFNPIQRHDQALPDEIDSAKTACSHRRSTEHEKERLAQLEKARLEVFEDRRFAQERLLAEQNQEILANERLTIEHEQERKGKHLGIFNSPREHDLEQARLAALQDRKLARERMLAYKRQESSSAWADVLGQEEFAPPRFPSPRDEKIGKTGDQAMPPKEAKNGKAPQSNRKREQELEQARLDAVADRKLARERFLDYKRQQISSAWDNLDGREALEADPGAHRPERRLDINPPSASLERELPRGLSQKTDLDEGCPDLILIKRIGEVSPRASSPPQKLSAFPLQCEKHDGKKTKCRSAAGCVGLSPTSIQRAQKSSVDLPAESETFEFRESARSPGDLTSVGVPAERGMLRDHQLLRPAEQIDIWEMVQSGEESLDTLPHQPLSTAPQPRHLDGCSEQQGGVVEEDTMVHKLGSYPYHLSEPLVLDEDFERNCSQYVQSEDARSPSLIEKFERITQVDSICEQRHYQDECVTEPPKHMLEILSQHATAISMEEQPPEPKMGQIRLDASERARVVQNSRNTVGDDSCFRCDLHQDPSMLKSRKPGARNAPAGGPTDGPVVRGDGASGDANKVCLIDLVGQQEIVHKELSLVSPEENQAEAVVAGGIMAQDQELENFPVKKKTRLRKTAAQHVHSSTRGTNTSDCSYHGEFDRNQERAEGSTGIGASLAERVLPDAGAERESAGLTGHSEPGLDYGAGTVQPRLQRRSSSSDAANRTKQDMKRQDRAYTTQTQQWPHVLSKTNKHRPSSPDIRNKSRRVVRTQRQRSLQDHPRDEQEIDGVSLDGQRRIVDHAAAMASLLLVQRPVSRGNIEQRTNQIKDPTNWPQRRSNVRRARLGHSSDLLSSEVDGSGYCPSGGSSASCSTEEPSRGQTPTHFVGPCQTSEDSDDRIEEMMPDFGKNADPANVTPPPPPLRQRPVAQRKRHGIGKEIEQQPVTVGRGVSVGLELAASALNAAASPAVTPRIRWGCEEAIQDVAGRAARSAMAIAAELEALRGSLEQMPRASASRAIGATRTRPGQAF